MAFRGERFVIDLSDDDEPIPPQPPSASLDFVADITERVPSAPIPPAPPRPASASTGFPEHKKRTRVSAFKKQRAGQDAAPTAPPKAAAIPQSRPTIHDEKKSINEENKRRLAAMSPAEIESERGELMSALPQSLIERLLRRANIEEDEDDNEEHPKENTNTHPSSNTSPPEKPTPTKPTKSVSFDIPEPQPQSTPTPSPSLPSDPEQPSNPSDLPSDLPSSLPLYPASHPPTGPIHFPRPPPRTSPMPPLDPSSPSFLSDLQTHYFPDTPHSPTSLSWLSPSPTPPDQPSQSPSNSPSPYHPTHPAPSAPPSALRFSLTAHLLSPRTALSLPTTAGLHHHGNDPEAAGYTIPELAMLSRSTLPAQRCLAWQVLGRLLYRLGRGEWGERGSGLVEGLWEVVEGEGVVGGMLREVGEGAVSGSEGGDGGGNERVRAGRIGKHASARAWAMEALWLWRMGGGGDRGLVRGGEVRAK
ncbi:hypothetical protein FQN52_003342 [Onygenales sp. PD_12]|nr:hypothetical protein FQN52_003342 [Onygenales sp. PD_12]